MRLMTQEGAFAEAEIQRPEAEFVVLHADLEHLRSAARQLDDDGRSRRAPAAEQDDRLHHIGPDHRFDATENCVEAGDDAEGR